jgi:hypothetical protein
LKVTVLSVYDDETVCRLSMDAGADRFDFKHDILKGLLASVDAALQKWLTYFAAIHLYSAGRMAPSMIMYDRRHRRLGGGFLGAAVTVVSFFRPTALLAHFIGRLW